MPRVRLALLDDHEVLLDSLSSWIAANAPDFDLVLSASTWLQLVHSDNFPTDLVFIDFQLKEPVSIEARVRTCRAAGAKVIVLSSLDSQESRDRALAAGAVAFLSKSLSMREVMDTARQVMGVERNASIPIERRPRVGRRRAQVAPEAQRERDRRAEALRRRIQHRRGRRRSSTCATRRRRPTCDACAKNMRK